MEHNRKQRNTKGELFTMWLLIIAIACIILKTLIDR
jgi:hypothetical protein